MRLPADENGATSNRSIPQRGNASARQHARVHLVTEARKVDVPQAQGPVDPEALAQGAADHAVEQRQVLREDQLCAVDDVLPREDLREEVAER